jgi:hypothetical protein
MYSFILSFLYQVYYPFDKFGYIDSNFIIDREHWYMAARISNDGMWRVSYGELNGLTRDEVHLNSTLLTS